MFEKKIISQDLRNIAVGSVVASFVGVFFSQAIWAYCVGLFGFALIIFGRFMDWQILAVFGAATLFVLVLVLIAIFFGK